MGQTTNLLLLLLPPELLIPFVTLMVMVGGLLIAVGARQKGAALVIAGVSLPIVMVIVEVLMTEFFMALPEELVTPVATAIMILLYAIIGWSLFKWVVGQKAIDEAKGQLLADAVKWLLRRVFSVTGMTVVAVVGFAAWMGALV